MQQHEEFPIDLIADQILARLPVKTLCRFRCVSKPWCSIISDPHFQKEHLRRSQHSRLLLVAKSDPAGDLVSLSTYNCHNHFIREFSIHVPKSSDLTEIRRIPFDLIESCQGLICLRGHFDGSILVCNPSTQETITLPQRPGQRDDLCVGFVYATSTGEFKVFRFFTRRDGHRCCEVFTLGNSAGWREGSSRIPFLPIFQRCLPLLHGALHMIPSIVSNQLHYDHYIAALNVDTEEIHGIPFPEIGFGEATMLTIYLAKLGGSLCLTIDFILSNKTLQLWFLKDYHTAKWVKQYNIDLFSAVSCVQAFPLEMMDNGSILLVVRSISEDHLCCYNIEYNCVAETMGVNCLAAYYIENLLPLGNR